MSTQPKSSRRFVMALASAAGVAGVVALFCCGPGTDRPSATAMKAEEAAEPVAATDTEAAAAPPPSRPDATGTPGGESSDAGTAATPADDAGVAARHPIAVAASRDQRDLELLSRIERELRRDPPPVVHALIAFRERGATRDELVAFVRERFPADLPLRAAAMRWIDQVAPGPGGTPAAPLPTGSGPSLVKPLEKAP